MPSTNLTDLVHYLRGPVLRVRTGLWLVPQRFIGREADKTAALGLAPVDIRQPILDGLLPNQTRLRLDPASILRALDTLVDNHLHTDCGLLLNLDLLLASQTSTARDETWELLYSGFPHRSRALLLTMPVAANHLLPKPDKLDQWRRDGRLAESS